MSEIRELITEDEPQTWTTNTERLIAHLSTTIKLSEFTMTPEGTLAVKEGFDPFADLQKDILSVPVQHRERARARALEIITGVMDKAKTRVLQRESNNPRSASRSREPDSEEEVSSSKVPKASPLSPPHLGEGSESWPALPTPGAKVGLQEPTQALGGQMAASPRREMPGTSSPRKALQPTAPQQSPMGATSPLKDSMAPKGPEAQLQLIPSQVAPKTDGLGSGLKNPGVPVKGTKDPLVPVRTPKHSEEESASKGVPQKGTKDRPQEAGNLGASNKVTKEVSKPLGSHLKTPQPRPQGSSGKGDSKVTTKAKQ